MRLYLPLTSLILLACNSGSTPDGGGNGPDGAIGDQCMTQVGGTPSLTYALVASGLDLPVLITSANGDPTRMYIVEQHSGLVKLVKNGVVQPTEFLNIKSRMQASPGNEEGFLGLAFHPGYGANGRFFVSFNDANHDSVVAEYRRSPTNPDIADPTPVVATVLNVTQPVGRDNHKGGNIAFSPRDGMLYIGYGDGGSQYDPDMNGQNTNVLLGKILRIDVDHGGPYTIPSDNPFANMVGKRGEIWHYGLRNPWRWSFDRASGDMFIGDVGQDHWEEIDFSFNGDKGNNFGWGVVEGMNHCPMCNTNPCPCTPPAGATGPIFEYNHNTGSPTGNAIIGGFVYHGCKMPGYAGRYFFSDDGGGFVASFIYAGGGVTSFQAFPSLSLGTPSSMGEDSDGELYICSVGLGRCNKIVPQ